MTGVTRTVLGTLADGAAKAGIVLGGRPAKPDAFDLRWVAALLNRNGVIEALGVAAAVLNHPANGSAWLADELAPHGETLEAGEIILGSSFTVSVEAQPRDSFHVDFRPVGRIAVRFG